MLTFHPSSQWNEPISLLQRVAEYMNYAYLLKMAAAQKVRFILSWSIKVSICGVMLKCLTVLVGCIFHRFYILHVAV